MSLLEIDRLRLSFGGLLAVDNVSLRVAEGEIVALAGPNGAGKSTLFNLISRIYAPDAGTMRFDGEDLARCRPHEIARLGIARTFQNVELFERATVLQNIIAGRHRHCRTSLFSELRFTSRVRRQEVANREAAERIIDFLALHPYRDRPIAGLPFGVRKVVELGRALACAPRLLLLDEPAAGLSAEERRDMGYWIGDIRRETGAAILMVEHDMRLVARACDRMVVLADGKILAEGPPAKVQRHPAVLAAYVGSAP